MDLSEQIPQHRFADSGSRAEAQSNACEAREGTQARIAGCVLQPPRRDDGEVRGKDAQGRAVSQAWWDWRGARGLQMFGPGWAPTGPQSAAKGTARLWQCL